MDDQTETHAEAEVKVELTRSEFSRLPDTLAGLGFRSSGVADITDYYLAHCTSPHGGWDFERVRWIRRKGWWRARKRWVTHAGARVRVEEEERLSRAEGLQLAEMASDRPTLRKTRHEFWGQVAGSPAVVALDELPWGGSSRYFLECEIQVPPRRYSQARAAIWRWLSASLGLIRRAEAPSMLDLATACPGVLRH